jgi:probable rRNA maturation factor
MSIESQTVRVSLQKALDDPEADCPDEADFAVWVQAALEGASGSDRRGGTVTVRLVSAEESAVLNSDYRDINGPTNVLAFPAPISPVPEAFGDEPELGDLVVCLDVAHSEAIEQGKTLERHLAHLTVHGCLHLLGYDHIDAAEAECMEDLERCVLAGLGLPDPYASTEL